MQNLKQDVKDLVKSLEDRLLEVEIKFISPHVCPTASPATYAIDVECYAIFCHAAFEEFAEGLCLIMLDYIEKSWNQKLFSKATLCLLHFDIEKSNSIVSKWDYRNKVFDYIKSEIHKRKGKLSTYAIKGNHGVGIEYLQSLFLPIGIDLPQDVNVTNSLKQLVNLRGFYAHAHSSSRPNVVTVVSPQMVRSYVNDVLEYMNSVANKAMNMSFYLW